MRRLEIREAAERDCRAADEVAVSAFAPLRTVYRPTDEAIKQQQKRQQAAVKIVAELAERIVGTVEVDEQDDGLQLVRWAVHPKFQRIGVARSMLAWIERHAKHRGRGRIVLSTIRETGNVAVFEGMGFAVVAERVAVWCVSDQFELLHDVTMAKDEERAPGDKVPSTGPAGPNQTVHPTCPARAATSRQHPSA